MQGSKTLVFGGDMKWWFIRRSLPFVLNIHNEIFNLKNDRGQIILSLPPLKLPGDIYSIVEFRIPMVGEYSRGNLPFSEFENYVEFLNQIIRLYLKVTGDTFNNGIIQEFNDKNDFFAFVSQGEYDDITNQYSNIGQSQLVKKLAYGSNRQIAGKIRELLRKGKDLMVEEELLIRAKSYLHASNYKMSVIESAILIEMLITTKIRNYLGFSKNTGKNKKDDIENFIKDSGITNLLLTLFPKIKPNIPAEVLGKCTSSIKKRNKIMHAGELSVTDSQAREAVTAAESLYNLV